jgi:hypothetical protein
VVVEGWTRLVMLGLVYIIEWVVTLIGFVLVMLLLSCIKGVTVVLNRLTDRINDIVDEIENEKDK